MSHMGFGFCHIVTREVSLGEVAFSERNKGTANMPTELSELTD